MNYQILTDASLQVEVCIQDCFAPLTDVSDPTSADSIQAQLPNEQMAAYQAIRSDMWEGWFQQWLEILKSDLPIASTYELSLRLTDDREIQTFNSQYRQKNQPTDVLAFAALEVDYPKLNSQVVELPIYLGDIVISVETAYRQAQQQGHSLQTELTWLATHGLLHLLGWDHPDDESLESMLKHQQILLKAVGLSADSAETS